MDKVSLIIPTLNEERSIGTVLDAISSLADEVIVVDGHSSDKTVEEAERRGARVIYDSKGKGSAVRLGFAQARGELVVMIDADEAHSRQEVQAVIGRLREGYEVVMPSRFMSGGGSEDITPIRVFGNNFYKFWVRLFWGVSYTDICYGFRGFSRDAIRKLGLKADGFDIETEISIKTARRGLKYLEVPSLEGQRMHGKGKLTFWTSLTIDKRILIELVNTVLGRT